MDNVSALETYVSTEFKNGISNRSDIRDKWQNNLYAFLRKASGIWAKDQKAPSWRSDAMDGGTRNKVLSFLAIMVDVFLRGGKIPFDLDPSPSELERSNMSIYQARDRYSKNIDDATAQINETLKLGNTDRELIKNFLAFGLYGNTYGKLVVESVKQEWEEPEEIPGVDDISRIDPSLITWKKKKRTKKIKKYVYRPNWAIVRDMEAPINKCAYVIDYDTISIAGLRKLKDKPGYIKEQIEDIISKNQLVSINTGATQTTVSGSEMSPDQRDIPYKNKPLIHAEYWGQVPKDKLEEFREKISDKKDSQWLNLSLDQSEQDGDMVEVMLELVDDRIIKVVEIDISERPFLEAETMMNPDGKGAQGIADNIEMDQLIANSIMRSLIDNKMLAANVILAMKNEFLENEFEYIHPGTQIEISADCDDARKALQQVVIQDVAGGIESLSRLIDDKKNENSMIPQISQGVAINRPETAYEASKRVEEASKFMGLNIRQFDEGILEPMIAAIHKYNANDPEATRGKGSFVVHVKGYSTYQDTIVRVEMLQRWLSIILANEQLANSYHVEKINNDIGLAMSLDVQRYQKSDEELAEEQSARAQQPDLSMDVQQSEIDKNKAEIESISQKTELERERLDLEKQKVQNDRVKLIVDARKKQGNVNTKEERTTE